MTYRVKKRIFDISFTLLIIISIFGYVNNIIALWNTNEITFKGIIRIIGIFIAPLGVIIGYF